MPLFATLGLSELPATAKRPAYPSTAVQLYSTKYINFITNTISNSKSLLPGDTPDVPRRFEVLSYQAVQVKDDQQQQRQSDTPGVVVSSPTTLDKHINPNLGVWDYNFQQNNDTDLISSLLNNIIRSKSDLGTFILTLDMDDTISIHPNLEFMIESILKYYDNGTNEKKDIDDQNADEQIFHKSTIIGKLRETKFGKPPEKNEEETTKYSSFEKHVEENNDMKISIVICAILPSLSPKTYVDKQAQHLVCYHLRKYAAEINCTLCFVRMERSNIGVDSNDNAANLPIPSEDSIGENEPVQHASFATVEGMTVDELTIAVKHVCTETNLKNETNTKSNKGEGVQSTERKPEQEAIQQKSLPTLYGPYRHDIDLINSALLRNASCPGIWDAHKDSLWEALPHTASDGLISSKVPRNEQESGDEKWLSKLVDSVSAFTVSGLSDGVSIMDDSVRSGKTKDSTKKRAGKKKVKPDNKDVANFFEDLLKK